MTPRFHLVVRCLLWLGLGLVITVRGACWLIASIGFVCALALGNAADWFRRKLGLPEIE